MSVILDALHKARDDRRSDGNYSTSRVVDVARPTHSLVKHRSSAWRSLFLVAILGSLLAIVFMVAAAGWWWFGNGGRRAAFKDMVASTLQSSTPSAPKPAPAEPLVVQPTAALVPVDLPPPVALSALPAQATAVTGGAQPAPAPATAQAAGAAAAPAAAPAPFRLGTIVCDGADCSASVNGRTVRVGDTVKEHQVVAITATEITLQQPGHPPVVLSLAN